MTVIACAGRLVSIAAVAAALSLFAAMPARAGNEPYLGWDFGGGFGIGVGVPPSAHDPCPTYGWSYYPYRCHYRPTHYYRRHHRRSEHQAAPNQGPSDAQ